MSYLLKETQSNALMQILTTILTTDTHPELKTLIAEHDLVQALQQDVKQELIRQDVEHVIMLHSIPGIDIKRDDKLIQKAVDYVIENYNYEHYYEFIAEFLRKETYEKTRLRFI